MKADKETTAKVLEWIAAHPGTTCRDIARDALGGSGDRCTTERRVAAEILYDLWRRGEVERHPYDVPGTSAWGYRYWKNDSKLKLPPKAP